MSFIVIGRACSTAGMHGTIFFTTFTPGISVKLPSVGKC